MASISSLIWGKRAIFVRSSSRTRRVRSGFSTENAAEAENVVAAGKRQGLGSLGDPNHRALTNSQGELTPRLFARASELSSFGTLEWPEEDEIAELLEQLEADSRE